MKQAAIPLDDANGWTAALREVRHGFAHTWDYCRALWHSTGQDTYLYRIEDSGRVAVCPFVERRAFSGDLDICTPYGFSGFTGNGCSDGFLEHWRAFAARRGYVCGYIGLNPVFERDCFVCVADYSRDNEVFVVDLRRPRETLYRNLSRTIKARLKTWPERGARLVFDKPRLIETFVELHPTFMRSVEASSVYRFAPRTLDSILGHNDVLVIGAERAGVVEAISVFACTPDCADYLFNVSVPEGREHAAALLWEAFQQLSARAIPVLNLGGGVRPGDGLSGFKAWFGGTRMALGCLKQVYDGDAYARLCNAAGVCATDRMGYFPPYRRPAPERADRRASAP